MGLGLHILTTSQSYVSDALLRRYLGTWLTAANYLVRTWHRSYRLHYFCRRPILELTSSRAAYSQKCEFRDSPLFLFPFPPFPFLHFLPLTFLPPWALEVFESWGSKVWPGPWRARRARGYNGGLGAEPTAGSRGRALGGGLGRRSLPEAESFLVLERPTERQNLSRCQLVVFRDMVQVYSQNLVSMVRIGCAVRKWIDFYETSSLTASTIQVR